MSIDSFPPEPHTPLEESARLLRLLEAAEADAALQRMEFIQSADAWERASAAFSGKIKEMQQSLRLYEEQIKAHEMQSKTHEMQINALKHELNAVYASSSWRITAPLRSAVTLLKKLQARKSAPVRRESSSTTGQQAADQGAPSAYHHASQNLPPQPSPITNESLGHVDAEVIMNQTLIEPLDVGDEPETVQHIYRQLVRIRRQVLETS